MLDNDQLTRDELRQFEAQATARIEAMAHDAGIAERFAALDTRLEHIERCFTALDRSSDVHCKTVERRLDATQSQTDQVGARLQSGIDEARRDLGRIVIFGLLGTAVSSALLCLGVLLVAR